MELGRTLRDLRLSDCPAITDESLVAVSAMCVELRSLEIDRVEKVTDEGVKSVAEGCKLLTLFSARRCDGLEARVGSGPGRGLHSSPSRFFAFVTVLFACV